MNRSKGHKLLLEAEADDQDRVIAGQSYKVRYLGSIEIPSSKGRGITDNAVNEIYSRYGSKAKLKTLTMKELFVSANCVSIREPNEGAVLLKYSTVNVTFCNTNQDHPSAFIFVGRGGPLLPLYAHVVHCLNANKANEIFTTMSQSFLVRSSLHKAKQIERAGWESQRYNNNNNNYDYTDHKTAPERYAVDSNDPNEQHDSTFDKENGTVLNEQFCVPKRERSGDEDLNNNTNNCTFGEFACANSQQESLAARTQMMGDGIIENSDANNNCDGKNLVLNTSTPEEAAMWSKAEQNEHQNGSTDYQAQVANMLLGYQLNSRGRSHTWHNTPAMPQQYGANQLGNFAQKPSLGAGMKHELPNGVLNHTTKHHIGTEDDDFSSFALERSAVGHLNTSLMHLVT